MTEKLFQFIWQFQYFNAAELRTVNDENLQVIFPGVLNRDQGPDFLNAQVRIEGMLLAGSVELHLKASQWYLHGHHLDPHYKNVILHVVFENDLDEQSIPVLELQQRIPKLLLERYADLMGSPHFIACASSLDQVKPITWASWKDRLLAERLSRKSSVIFGFLEQNGWHWEECFWWLLCRSFGARVNADAFEQVARSIPLKILARHKQQIHQVEALLFGQAGLLHRKFNEAYPKLLQREYRFLRKKWVLQMVHAPMYFLRMRPGNFPSVRLAQLAVLIQQSAHLFSKVLELEKAADLFHMFDVTANDYWHYHYRFDEPSGFKRKKLGKDMIRNIIINTVIPVLFAYGLYHKEENQRMKAINWLGQLEAEDNSIIKGFSDLDIKCSSAFDTQALIELKTKYCDNRYCLQCAIGNAVLKIT